MLGSYKAEKRVLQDGKEIYLVGPEISWAEVWSDDLERWLNQNGLKIIDYTDIIEIREHLMALDDRQEIRFTAFWRRGRKIFNDPRKDKFPGSWKEEDNTVCLEFGGDLKENQNIETNENGRSLYWSFSYQACESAKTRFVAVKI